MITVTHYKVRHPCNNVKENYKQTAFIACESPVHTLFVSLLSFCPPFFCCASFLLFPIFCLRFTLVMKMNVGTPFFVMYLWKRRFIVDDFPSAAVTGSLCLIKRNEPKKKQYNPKLLGRHHYRSTVLHQRFPCDCTDHYSGSLAVSVCRQASIFYANYSQRQRSATGQSNHHIPVCDQRPPAPTGREKFPSDWRLSWWPSWIQTHI